MSFTNPSHYTMNMMNSNQSNFNNAFNPNPNFIPHRDTKNYGNIIVNNVNDNIVSEIVTEYTLHVDSIDRDLTIFPNPYKFTLSLGGPATTSSSGGVPDPRIDVSFRNVKYVKLKYLMLPRHINYKLVTDGSGNKTYSTYTASDQDAGNKATILSNYRYLLLRIKEIANDKLYSTNDIIKNDCFVIYRDSNYGYAVNDLWFATQPVKIFYDNGLQNLSKLTIEILKPDGTPLQVLSSVIDTFTTTSIPNSEINLDQSTANPSSNFYTSFNQDIQTSMEFELGVCENQVNSQKNYR